MPCYPANPALFIGRPLTLTKTVIAGETAPHDYVVQCGPDWPVGRIYRQDTSSNPDKWVWTVTGPGIPHRLHPSGGRVASLDEAKAAVRAKFNAWLAWAVAQGGEHAWTKGPPAR